MCGIAGFVSFDGHDPAKAEALVRAMNGTLVHRGPDAEGVFVDTHVALGHRRLSIIDRASGAQPMTAMRADDPLAPPLTIVFNGEIYNFGQLRTELEALGHRFATRSDTEVILRAWASWGEDSLARMNGMFAFALWDPRARRLVLARDRVGKKPLYWFHDGKRVAFASELKALRALPGCPSTIDPQALDCYFSLGFIPSPLTIHRNVAKLPAAHWMVAERRQSPPRRYWRLDGGEPRALNLDEAAEALEPLLDDAVRCRLVSEVPLGAFLSGGIDSSLVVASMAQASARSVITNTIGFDDDAFSETEVARATAGHLQTNHHEFTVRPDAVDVLPRIARHCDEPLADASTVPTWYVCQMARKSVTVALSGDGGDESFGGYTFRYRPHRAEARLRGALPAPLRTMAFGALGSLWPGAAWLPRPLRLKTIFENLAVADVEAYYRDLVWLRDDLRESLYGLRLRKALGGFTPRELVYPLYNGHRGHDAVARAQLADVHGYMTDDVLVKVDRMSMAHSLEVRSPLLDYRVLEFAATLPDALKLGDGRGKRVLRHLAARRLPETILNMPKRGFSMPIARWLRGELREAGEAWLFASNGPLRDLFEDAVLRRVWAEHQSGARDHHVLLWAAMMFVVWHEQCVTGA
ncbi:MAG: asparagine synthase (glutamine-hydrolyzing) [Burkholderiaceae bacterium]